MYHLNEYPHDLSKNPERMNIKSKRNNYVDAY